MLKVVRKDGGGEVQSMSDSMTNGDASPKSLARGAGGCRPQGQARHRPSPARRDRAQAGRGDRLGRYRPGDTLSGESPFPRRSTCRAAHIGKRCRC